MADHHQQNSTQQEKKRLAKEIVGERESVALRELTKYTKMLGTYLIKGMSTFTDLFRKKLEGKTQFKEGKEEIEVEQKEKEKMEEKRVGFRVDFNQFRCDDKQLQSVRLSKPEAEVKPVRSFHFNVEDYKEENSFEGNSKDDLSFLLKRIGSKKIKKDLVCLQPDSISKAVSLETPQIAEHWNKISNKITEDWVLAISNLKEKQEREKKKNQSNDESTHRKYINDVSRNLASRSLDGGGKRLSSLMMAKKEKVQQRPRKKYTHIQEEMPQIYNVQKVLSVLEKQKNQFMEEKRKIKQDQLRAEREAQRLEEEARQRQKKAQQQLQARQKKQEEIRLMQDRKAEQMKSQLQRQAQEEGGKDKQEEEKKQLSAISEKEEEPNSENPQEAGIPTFGLSFRRQINKDNAESIQQISPKPIQSPKKSEKQKPEEPVIPSELETPKKQNQSVEEKSFIPALSEEKRKNNPFIKTSPAVGLSLQDLISKDSKFTSFLNSSPSNFMSQNMFAVQTPAKEIQDPPQSFNSPTNFMNNQIGNIFPSNPVPTAPPVTFTSPSSNLNQQQNFSFQSSNPNSSFGVEQQPQQMFSQSQQNGPSLLGLGTSPGLGMFTNNSNAVKLFENNIFMNSSQRPSLFGDTSSHQRQDHSSRTGGRSKRNPIRIS